MNWEAGSAGLDSIQGGQAGCQIHTTMQSAASPCAGHSEPRHLTGAGRQGQRVSLCLMSLCIAKHCCFEHSLCFEKSLGMKE